MLHVKRQLPQEEEEVERAEDSDVNVESSDSDSEWSAESDEEEQDYDQDHSADYVPSSARRSDKTKAALNHEQRSTSSKDKSDQSGVGGDIEDVSYTMKELEGVTRQGTADDQESITHEDSQKNKNRKPSGKKKRRRDKIPPGPRICSICGADFTDSKNPGAMRSHIWHNHRVLPRYPCKYFGCTLVFRQEKDREKHQAKHANPTEKIKNFKCPSEGCNRWYGSQTSVKYHLATSHGEEKPSTTTKLICEHCGNSYASHAAYIRHVRQKHDPGLAKRRKTARRVDEDEIDVIEEILAKWYLCIYCKADFKSIEEFQEHFAGKHSTLQNVITVEYRCTYCNEAFTSVRALWTHRVATHFKTAPDPPSAPPLVPPSPPIRPPVLTFRAPLPIQPERPTTAYLPKNKHNFTVVVKPISPAAPVSQNVPFTPPPPPPPPPAQNEEISECERGQGEDEPQVECGTEEEPERIVDDEEETIGKEAPKIIEKENAEPEANGGENAEQEANGEENAEQEANGGEPMHVVGHVQTEPPFFIEVEVMHTDEVLPRLTLVDHEEIVSSTTEQTTVEENVRETSAATEGKRDAHPHFVSELNTRLNENSARAPKLVDSVESTGTELSLEGDVEEFPLSIQVSSTPISFTPNKSVDSVDTLWGMDKTRARRQGHWDTTEHVMDLAGDNELVVPSFPRPTPTSNVTTTVVHRLVSKQTPLARLPPTSPTKRRTTAPAPSGTLAMPAKNRSSRPVVLNTKTATFVKPAPASRPIPRKKKRYGAATITIVVPIKSKLKKERLEAKNKELCGMIRELVVVAMESDEEEDGRDIISINSSDKVPEVPSLPDESKTKVKVGTVRALSSSSVPPKEKEIVIPLTDIIRFPPEDAQVVVKVERPRRSVRDIKMVPPGKPRPESEGRAKRGRGRPRKTV